MNPSPTTIPEVLNRFDEILDQAIAQKSVVGYFPALYKNVTIEIKSQIDKGTFFDDNERMERFVIQFASRFFTAYDQYFSGELPPDCWYVAYETRTKPNTIILQHMALAMNAHILLDLPIVTARIAPGDAIYDLEQDFLRINCILIGMSDEVEDCIAALSPLIKKLDKILRSKDEFFVGLSLEKARDSAWEFALELAPLPLEDQVKLLYQRDRKIATAARYMSNPGPAANAVIRSIAVRESKDVPLNINHLLNCTYNYDCK